MRRMPLPELVRDVGRVIVVGATAREMEERSWQPEKKR